MNQTDNSVNQSQVYSKDKKGLYYLLKSMAMIGCIGFGGGNAMVPVIYKKTVVEDKLVSEKEFETDVIIANITPGALPIELASGIGNRIAGIRGSIACATGMALPGAILTIFCLSIFSLLTDNVIMQIQYATVGISAYIAYILSGYIYKAVAEKKTSNETKKVVNTLKNTIRYDKNVWLAILIIAIIFILTGEKSLYRIINVHINPIFGIGAIYIFAMAFFIISFWQVNLAPKLKIVLTTLISITFILCTMKTTVIQNPIIFTCTKSVMGIISIWGIIVSLKNSKDAVRIDWRDCLKKLGILALLSGLAIAISTIYLTRAYLFYYYCLLSSLLSFGGGDAYLAIASAMFVDVGAISEWSFYSELIPLVNILPGSILCKTMSGIGFIIGQNVDKGYMATMFLALVGFICSIVASCATFTFAANIYEAFGRLPIIISIQNWIKPIISGLLLTVILSLTKQVRMIDCSDIGWLFVIIMAVIYGLNLVLQKFNVASIIYVLIDLVVALILCNGLYRAIC